MRALTQLDQCEPRCRACNYAGDRGRRSEAGQRCRRQRRGCRERCTNDRKENEYAVRGATGGMSAVEDAGMSQYCGRQTKEH